MGFIDFIAQLLALIFAPRGTKATAPKQFPPAPAPDPQPQPPQPPVNFLASLKAQTRAQLTQADYEALAGRLRCEWQALAAVAEVESGRLGAFAPDGRPIILFERHLFSAKTGGSYDHTYPHLSQPRAGGYPTSQALRWAQLAEAFSLHPEAALESASWGRFQLLGQNYPTLHMESARDYVAKLARSERDQLDAFEAFIRANGLVDRLRAKDWAGFARGYNGANYAANRYHERMAEAYARIRGRGLVS